MLQQQDSLNNSLQLVDATKNLIVEEKYTLAYLDIIIIVTNIPVS